MTSVIPFVGKMPEAEAREWIGAMAPQLPGCRIARFVDLKDDDRSTAEVAIVANPDPAELAMLPNLKWVQSLWAGVERLVAEMPGDAVRIVRLADPQMADTMAEAVLAWTLYLHRDMPRYRAQQLARIWQQHALPLPVERRIGLLGLGVLGRRSAELLAGHGFSVAGWSRSNTRIENVETSTGSQGLRAMLARTDILVCLLPLTAETRGILSADTLSLLPKNAAVINFSRGPVVQTGALTALLDSGQLSHAVLDVFDDEPLPPQSPLWTHPAITVLPHISAPTNVGTASAIACANIRHFLKTGEMPESVNRERGY